MSDEIRKGDVRIFHPYADGTYMEFVVEKVSNERIWGRSRIVAPYRPDEGHPIVVAKWECIKQGEATPKPIEDVEEKPLTYYLTTDQVQKRYALSKSTLKYVLKVQPVDIGTGVSHRYLWNAREIEEALTRRKEENGETQQSAYIETQPLISTAVLGALL